MAIQGEKIAGGKYLFYKDSKGEWVGTLEKQGFWSVTYLPKGTEYKEAETKELMVNILKTDKVPLKKDNLDEDTVKELKKAGITIKDDITPIEIIKK